MQNRVVVLSETQLKTVINECIEKALKPLKTKTTEHKANPLMTIKEVCQFFNVSASTIHCWRKEGRLKAYYKGRRVYFKRAEVETSLVQSKN